MKNPRVRADDRFNPEGDNLTYVVNAEPGGCDGLDFTSKGGPVWAFATREEAERKVGKDTRYKIVPKVVNGPKVRARIKRKLTVVERYYLRSLGVEV
jgi:hypothetical protein